MHFSKEIEVLHRMSFRAWLLSPKTWRLRDLGRTFQGKDYWELATIYAYNSFVTWNCGTVPVALKIKTLPCVITYRFELMMVADTSF